MMLIVPSCTSYTLQWETSDCQNFGSFKFLNNYFWLSWLTNILTLTFPFFLAISLCCESCTSTASINLFPEKKEQELKSLGPTKL